MLRQKQGNLSIFIIFNQAKFELFRRFHKPFTQMARFYKRSIDMVYTTQNVCFGFKNKNIPRLIHNLGMFYAIIYLNPNIFLNFATDLHLYSKINFLILKINY